MDADRWERLLPRQSWLVVHGIKEFVVENPVGHLRYPDNDTRWLGG